MTIAQKGGPPDKLPPYCLEEYREKIGNCNKDDCKAECTRKRNGHGLCAGALEQESCICTYQPKNKRNPCSLWFLIYIGTQIIFIIKHAFIKWQKILLIGVSVCGIIKCIMLPNINKNNKYWYGCLFDPKMVFMPKYLLNQYNKRI